MAVNGLLSLRWNNHSSSFLKQLSFLRNKETYSDLTLVCGGQFYQVHRLVVSGCSEYFRAILEHTPCRHPAVVLQDLPPHHLEALLSYMYLGHVSVPHDDLSGLIRAAECLAIKGLAVPDEATSLPQSEPHGRPAAAAQEEGPEEGPPNPKRRRQDRDASSPAPLVQDTPAAENYNEGRVRGRVSRGSSPQPPSSTYTFPTQQEPTYMDTTAMKVEQVEEVEEKEDEVKCEEDNLDLPQSCGGLACHIEEGQATYTQTLPGTSISGGSGGGGGGVLPQYPGPPQSLEEVVSQALPGTSGVNGDTGEGWEGSQAKGELTPCFNLDSYTHHAPLHQRKSFLSLGLQGRGRPEQEPADITGSTLPLPFNLSPGTLQGDRREGEGMGRAWREWCCSYPKCGYITDRESWLRQHVRTHTGEKPFACPYCSFRSAQKGNVTVHVRRLHHRDGLNLFGSSDPSSSSSDTVSDPEFNLQWLVKDKFQGGSEFAKEQNGVCD